MVRVWKVPSQRRLARSALLFGCWGSNPTVLSERTHALHTDGQSQASPVKDLVSKKTLDWFLEGCHKSEQMVLCYTEKKSNQELEKDNFLNHTIRTTDLSVPGRLSWGIPGVVVRRTGNNFSKPFLLVWLQSKLKRKPSAIHAVRVQDKGTINIIKNTPNCYHVLAHCDNEVGFLQQMTQRTTPSEPFNLVHGQFNAPIRK